MGRRGPLHGAAAVLALSALLTAACGSSGGKSGTGSSGTAATSGGSGGSGGIKLAQSGGAGEGPYPWKYPASGTESVGSGTMISGTACTSDAGQFPYPYAAPCIAKWSGDNGGATYNGVTDTTITLGQRTFPSSANGAEIAAVAASQGIALPQVRNQVEQVFLNYFNKVYDLYGRHVVIQPYTATGNATTEALGQGQAQACADADKEANQMHVFADSGLPDDNDQLGGSAPFTVCAAQDKMVEFFAAPYFDEAWYQQYNPYAWAITQECQRIGQMTGQVYSTLLAGKPAIYAGDADLRSKTRKFGTYYPNLPEYTSCVELTQHVAETQYHVPTSAISTVFTYGLDISTFQQSAQQAIVSFKAQGVTTIVTACDPFSLSLLTKAAAQQNYHPEWLLNGVALDDTDTVAQTYDQAEVAGHLFGLSEAAPQNTFFGPDSPAGKLYQQLTGHVIPPGTDGDYPYLVWIFNALQAAGPDLTPQNVARGIHALPTLGAPSYVYGTWSQNTGPSGTAGSGDHTAITDDRFVYWDAGATSPINGKKGTYVAVFDGKRYSLGNWPSTLPQLFTSPGSQATS